MELLAKAVSLRLGGRDLLKDIDFYVRDREFVGIIGPNGSGKTTFLQCLYRVKKPTEGQIYLNGVKLENLSYRESALQMAVVAQQNHYNFDFSVMEVVLMGRSPHKKVMEQDNQDDYNIAARSLDLVGMENFADQAFNTLSGGEQQRVILARALTQKTDCLILDEPTNHLDIKYQLQIMNIVKRLKMTVVAAIHDLNIAAMYCDRLVALKGGRVIAAGTPKELLTSAFIKELYGVESKIYYMDDNKVHIAFMLGAEK